MDNFTELIFDKDPTMKSRHEAWLLNPPMGVTLGMSVEELLAPGKKKSNRGQPPRPQQSYILYRKNFRALHWTMRFEDVSTCSRIEWNTAPPLVREFFEMLSGEAKKRHAIQYPDYKYKPRRADNFRDNGVARPLRRRRRRQPPSAGVEQQQSGPETAAPLQTNTAGMNFEPVLVPENLNYMCYGTLDDGDQPGSCSSVSPVSTVTDEFSSPLPRDDDGFFFFDFDYYTNDDTQ